MTPLSTNGSWLMAAAIVAVTSLAHPAACFTTSSTPSRLAERRPQTRGDISPATTTHLCSSSSSPPSQTTSTQSSAAGTNDRGKIFDATLTLQNYDHSQQSFVQADGSQGMGGGLSALHHIQSLNGVARSSIQDAVRSLVVEAHAERAVDSSRGRIMLGFCASNAPEALSGLKSWVSSLDLPRGMLHGMDVDGVPIPVEELGSVYVKYSTGGAMTFAEMRRSGRGFDALWRPGDALLETYDGDFRGVYLHVELEDGVFRQFGVLPTDLFMEEEEW